MELDFDSWDDYVPVGDNAITPKEVNNPNIINLKKDDSINLLEIEKDSFDEIFDYQKEYDFNENEIMRFKKVETLNNGVEVFYAIKDEDSFLIKKEEELYFLNVYQSNEYYEDDNKLTFTGWDYNIIVNLNTITAKTKYVR
jgi:hypothetical protein